MNKLSLQEAIIGFIATVTLVFKIGLIAIPIAMVSAILWAVGGAYLKTIRREGVSLLCGISSAILLKNPYCLFAIPLSMLVLHQGDGFPDHRPSTKSEGSFIGKIVEYFIKNEKIGGLVTKLFWPVILQLAFVPIWRS